MSRRDPWLLLTAVAAAAALAACGGDAGGGGAPAPSCDDGVRNGDEAGVDCGGSCAACVVAPTCSDSARNQGESDVDCGGPCDPCALGATCGGSADCATGLCADGLCANAAPTCENALRDGDETDVDCGGAVCGPCDDGEGCAQASDCAGGVCAGGSCSDCDNGLADGDETDVDCGGSCGGCATGEGCGGNEDCAVGTCAVGVCAEPSCEDGAEDGDETDVDCGGSCEPCDPGAGCASDADCRFEGVCEADGVASICRNATIGDIGNGERFTCVRLAEPGKVACWGANDYGQLGLGDTEARSEPTIVPGLDQVMQLSVGLRHVCARRADGAIVCWGDDTFGQTGEGTVGGKTLSPVTVPSFTGRAVSAGARHTCAIGEDDRIACWGDNGGLQVAMDTTLTGTAAPVSAGLEHDVSAVSAGGKHTCARISASSVYASGTTVCFGDNEYGQINPVGPRMTYEEEREIGDPLWGAVVTGLRATCLRTNGGLVSCFGWERGFLGNDVAPGAKHVACDLGGTRCCAATGGSQAGQNVRCWAQAVAVTMPDVPADATQVAVGPDHVCVVRADRAVACFGANGQGQLGRGVTSASESAVADVRYLGWE